MTSLSRNQLKKSPMNNLQRQLHCILCCHAKPFNHNIRPASPLFRLPFVVRQRLTLRLNLTLHIRLPGSVCPICSTERSRGPPRWEMSLGRVHERQRPEREGQGRGRFSDRSPRDNTFQIHTFIKLLFFVPSSALFCDM